MPALFTPLRQRRQQQRLERAWHQQASPIPVPRPRLPWLPLMASGVVLGLVLGWAHRWLISPIAPEPAVEQRRCRFHVPELSAQDLEPRLTSEQEARIRRWLGPQLPKAPAPAPPAEPAQADHC